MERNLYIRRITVYRDKRGEYRWRMQAWNWRIIADSAEGYKQHEKAIDAAIKMALNIEGVVEVFDKVNNMMEYPE